MIALRCSSLDRIELCPASATPPALRVEGDDSAARLGSAVHEMMSAHIDGREIDAAAVAQHWRVERADLDHLVAVGRGFWSRIEGQFPNPVTEHEYEPDRLAGDVTLSGHADVVSLSDDGTLIRLLDFKSGWADATHESQMRGYALLAIRQMPMADRVQATVLKLRFGDAVTYEWTRAELEEWAASFADGVAAGLELYRPSTEACGYCPRAHECPARRAFLTNAARMVNAVATEAQDDGPLTVTPEQLCRVLEFARVLEKTCKHVVDLVKAEVQLAGGSITLADGRELRIAATVFTDIDYAAGEGVLHARLGDAVRECLEVNKKKAVDAVRARAGRGQKQHAEEEFLAELDRAAAIKMRSVSRLEIKQGPKRVTTGEQP